MKIFDDLDQEYIDEAMADTRSPRHLEVLLSAVKQYEKEINETYYDMAGYELSYGQIDLYLPSDHPDCHPEFTDLQIMIDFDGPPDLSSVYIRICGEDDEWEKVIPYRLWSPGLGCSREIKGEEAAIDEF